MGQIPTGQKAVITDEDHNAERGMTADWEF